MEHWVFIKKMKLGTLRKKKETQKLTQLLAKMKAKAKLEVETNPFRY